MKLANEFSRFINNDQFSKRFPHIKRMRKVVIKENDLESSNSSSSSNEIRVEILIGETQDCLPIEAENYLRKNCIDKIWNVIEVPKNPPLTREKFSQLSKIWPLSFLKPKFNPEILSDQVQRESDRLVRLACKVGEFAHSNGNPPRGCVITLKGKVVAIGEDSRNSEYPWMHSVMKAVEHFSKRVCASSLSMPKVTNSLDSKLQDDDQEQENQKKEDHQDHLIAMKSKYSISENQILSDSELKDQYLCTNGVAYLSHEPCISCSMALVHSRISKVFYMYKDKERGFLGSNHKLHCVSKLNHHYRVFRASID
ncbi:cytidine deoxycytidylate deaminase family [Cryptosporidium sp. chipmunk genotype I]|uniref:cytidine deoxycytidylate deaminase family n=1 Tax=Cryptosporidium sp. chipmunk genotype I TaxID=1280935 RepID=UPI00351A0253|nr:cytidine deoxycytidylate deaminase family [Cryptosporidium sp. chipmunk genotype I]